MNYLIQRGKVRGQVINVPDGLPELLSDIAREVLRCQPSHQCLCQFIIDYLHSVIVAREKAKAAKSIIDRALHKVDQIIRDMCICSITKEKAEEMTLVMEECFKRFLEQRRCETGKKKEIIRFDREDLLDELIRKCKFSEDELKVSRPLIEDAYNRFAQAYTAAAKETDGTESLYQYFRDRETQRWKDKMQNEAATKIQALFRGYLVRRSLIDSLIPKVHYQLGPIDNIPSDLFRDMDRAARIIQKFFRERIEGQKYDDEFGVRGSQQSKETIVEEGIGETAPDVKPHEIPEVPKEQAVPEEIKADEIETAKEEELPQIEEVVHEAEPQHTAEPAAEPVAEPPVAPEVAEEIAAPENVEATEPAPEPPLPAVESPEEPPAAQAEENGAAPEQPAE